MLYSTLVCTTVQYCIVLTDTQTFSLLYCTVLYCALLYCTIQSCAVHTRETDVYDWFRIGLTKCQLIFNVQYMDAVTTQNKTIN
jgi:hypothetical protein